MGQNREPDTDLTRMDPEGGVGGRSEGKEGEDTVTAVSHAIPTPSCGAGFALSIPRCHFTLGGTQRGPGMPKVFWLWSQSLSKVGSYQTSQPRV